MSWEIWSTVKMRHSGKESLLGWATKQFWRRWWFWRPNVSLEDPNSRIHAQIPGQTITGPVLQVHITRYPCINGIEIQILSRTTQERISWIVICRGKNRHVDDLHLNDADHNPTCSELLLERSLAKESEPCSTEIEHSSIEETLAKQFEIPTNTVCNSSEELIPIETREWNDILACKHFKGKTFEAEVSTLVMRLVRRHDQDERETEGAVHLSSMCPKLWKPLRKAGRQKFSDSDWLRYMY